MPQHPDPRRLPYQVITDPAYAQTAAATFSLVDVGPGNRALRGPCPRCTSEFTTLFGDIFDGQRTIVAPDPTTQPGVPAPSPQHTIEPVACLCEHDEHAGRPPDRSKGCGAYWNFLIAKPA